MTRRNYTNLWFAICAALVIVVFFWLHPVQPFQNKIIAGDGFGYYAYLPAKFIYHDTDLTFAWFDKAFYANYDPAMSPNPTGNFLVPYQEKMINMYYPCLSFFQLPFFLLSHAAAGWLHYPADGYSLPYQMGIGLAALFYALVGLWLCQKLILRLSSNQNLSLLVPTLIFFGSNIFICTIYLGCYTHCYTFCFTAIGFYAAWHFFNRADHKWLCVSVIVFCSLVILFLRPLNIILLTGYLYFYKPFSIRELKESREPHKLLMLLTLVLIFCLVYYNLSITYTQSHTLFVNTYSAFKFYFNRWDHVWDTVASFQGGFFWYTPLAVLCLAALFFCRKQPKLLWLILPFIAMILLCGFWWYWKVINRTLADLAMVMAILLMHVLMQVNKKATSGKLVFASALVCVPFYQLKDYQLRTGILNGFNTYSKYYLEYFFRLRPANVFPVDPKTIVERKGYFYSFETGNQYYITDKNKFGGRRSATLNASIDYACTQTYQLPFIKQEFKKVRVSFVYYRTETLNDLRLVFSFQRKGKVIQEKTFYINPKNSVINTWDYKEFGSWLPDNVREGDTFSVYFWDPEKQAEAFIDDMQVEFIVTDGSDEMVM